MTFPFLIESKYGEWVLRIKAASETEAKRHAQRKGEITQDHITRGLLGSSVYLRALFDEDVHNLREMIRIARDELFKVVESKRRRLRETDIEAIKNHFHQSSAPRGEEIVREFNATATQHALSLALPDSLRREIQESIQQEGVSQVAIRAAELTREQQADRKKWWFERVEKLVWLVVGTGIGIFGTLATQRMFAPGEQDRGRQDNAGLAKPDISADIGGAP